MWAAPALTVRLTAPCAVAVTGTLKMLGPPVIVPAVPLTMVSPPAAESGDGLGKGRSVKAMGAVWSGRRAEVTVTLGVAPRPPPP